MKITSKTLQFLCYDYFEDCLATITFAKNFSVQACVVSKIFANKNMFATIEQTTTVINNCDC